MLIFEPTLKDLLDQLSGNDTVFISAPWIAVSRVKALTRCLDETCSIEIWIRMNPSETEKNEMLSVLDALEYFKKIRMFRNKNLHWKAYLCKGTGYIGSANFTERGVPDNLDTNSSIEGLLKLTKAQLGESWKFKDMLSKKMKPFENLEEARKWWIMQPHKKIDRHNPDDAPSEEDDWPEKPHDISIR